MDSLGRLRAWLKRNPGLVALVHAARQAPTAVRLTLSRWRLAKRSGYLRSVYGVWLRDRWDDVTFRFCVLGKYGYFYSEWLREQDDCVFLDIGANVGLYSLIAGANPGVKAIHAFEPVPETFRFLADNIRRNGVGRCTPHPVGVSAAPSVSRIRVKRGHSGVSTLRDASMEPIGFDSTIEIRVVGPEYLDREVDASIASRVIVKLDVEGHEEVVLNALMRTRLWPKVANIYYEVNERHLDHRSVLSTLQNAGFRVIKKNGDGQDYDLMVERELDG